MPAWSAAGGNQRARWRDRRVRGVRGRSRPDPSGWCAARGLYTYPYYGYGYGWNPGLGYYDLPYAREDIAELEPLDYERFELDD